MRLLHTSDWHLGKSIHGQNLLVDQTKVLDDIVMELSKGYDGLLISGDIYDRSIPPSDAIELFSWFIEKMVDLGITTVIIPGNHDSPSRLDFASGVLERSGIHFRCRYDRITEPVIIEDEEGEVVEVFALPFVDEVMVRSRFPDENIRTHQEATGFLLDMIRESVDPSRVSILVAHTYTGKEALRSDSERELLVGGQGYIDPETFRGFDHVALGHLHRPQKVSSSNRTHYSGSLIPYSFSEVGRGKSSLRLDISDDRIHTETFDHELRRNFSVLKDSMNELLEGEKYSGFKDHYLSVELTDKGLLVDIHKRLMERFPYLLEVDQPALHIDPSEEGSITREEADNPSTLFSLFLEMFDWDEHKERAAEIFDGIRKELERREVES